MKTYWDYNEKERSKMDKKQIESLLEVELMTKGVLKVKAPELKPIKEIKVAKQTFFSVGSIFFKTVEQAKQFLTLNPFSSDYDYSVGYDLKYPKDYALKEIIQVELCDKQSYMNAKTILSQNNSAKKYNEEVQEKYDKACKKMTEILQGVWDNWYECKSLTEKHQKVTDTKKEYMQLTNNNEVLAEQFLSKVFSIDEIRQAKEWFDGKMDK